MRLRTPIFVYFTKTELEYSIITMFIINLLLYDVNFYITHILLHRYFYKYHKLHHTHTTLDYRASYTAHWLENILQTYVFVIMYLFGSNHTMVTFIFVSIRGIINHEPRLNLYINRHHILHHKHQNCNYGEYYLDYIMNTLYCKTNQIIK
jgi:sterol desaturase/sphingolipid hydroxylase (fatty acid hydroxylase superfamily)